MSETMKLPKVLACLLSHDKSTSLWLTHCLNFDIVASGPTENAAWDTMKNVVRVHVESCFADGFKEGLSKQADRAFWVEFVNQMDAGNFRSDSIEFHLSGPQASLSGFRIKGVEVDSLPSFIRATA